MEDFASLHLPCIDKGPILVRAAQLQPRSTRAQCIDRQRCRSDRPAFALVLRGFLTLATGTAILTIASAATALQAESAYSERPDSKTPLTTQEQSSIPSFLLSQSSSSEQRSGSLTVTLNDRGPLVTELQERLTHLGYYQGSITGYFGPLTQTAVIQFQQANGLTADGVVGPATEAALRRPTNQTAQTSTPTSTSNSSSANSDDNLQQGDSNEAVTTLQQRLIELGYFDGPVTGFFGLLTEEAVVRFQQEHGLTPDGIVGSATQTALSRPAATAETTAPSTTILPAAPLTTPPSAISNGTLRLGDSGSEVSDLQRQLQTLGYYSGSINGTFDALTEEAVLRFQRSQGLTADGIVGPATLSVLESSNGGGTSQPPSAQVLELQTRLQRRGFYSGPLDGVLGPQTRAAITRAQTAYNLSEADILNGVLP